MSNTDLPSIPTTGGKSLAKQVTGKLKIAIDLMTWEGKPYSEAAKIAGLTTRGLRMALEKEHVLRYMRSQRRALLASEGPKTIARLAELRDQNDNRNAAVASARTILNITDEEARSPGLGRPQVAGFVIVLRENGPPSDPPLRSVTIEGNVVDEDEDGH